MQCYFMILGEISEFTVEDDVIEVESAGIQTYHEPFFKKKGFLLGEDRHHLLIIYICTVRDNKST